MMYTSEYLALARFKLGDVRLVANNDYGGGRVGAELFQPAV